MLGREAGVLHANESIRKYTPEQINPIQHTSKGWQWGTHSKFYPTREGALKQMRAIVASGYKRRNPTIKIGDLVTSIKLPPPNKRWGIGRVVGFTNKFAIVNTNIGDIRIKKDGLRHYKEPEYEHLFSPFDNPVDTFNPEGRRFINATKLTGDTEQRVPWRVAYEYKGKEYARLCTTKPKAIKWAKENLGVELDRKTLKPKSTPKFVPMRKLILKPNKLSILFGYYVKNGEYFIPSGSFDTPRRWWKEREDRRFTITKEIANQWNANLGKFFGTIQPGQEAYTYKREVLVRPISGNPTLSPVDYSISKLESMIPSMSINEAKSTHKYAIERMKATEKTWGRYASPYTDWDNIAFLCRKRLRRLGIAIELLRENPTLRLLKNRNPEGLYQQFHGNPPKARRVKARVPNKGEKLIAIGKLVSVEYQPYGSSKRQRVHYTHNFGDTGDEMLPDKPILATGANGKGLYIIEDKASPFFSNRGIIG